MLIKDKDLLADDAYNDVKRARIKKENMHSAWGDVFDYYLSGITTNYLKFSSRATRLEFWGFVLVSCMVFLCIYPLGVYVDIPMLAYYYVCATFLPFVAVLARRLHDLNKSALLYLGIFVIACLSALLIGYWAIILILIWSVYLIRLLSEESDINEGLYGEPLPNDENYGSDNLPILRKFRLLALCLLSINLGMTFISFNDWQTQASFMGTKDKIMEDIEQICQKAQYSDVQCEQAKDAMLQTLKTWSGEVVTQEAISKAMEEAIQSVAPKSIAIDNKPVSQ